MKLDELEQLANAATPGPWMRLFGERTVYDRMNDGCRGNAIVRTDFHPPTGRDVDNLDFIAAANPATIKRLIALCRMQDEALVIACLLHSMPPKVEEALAAFDEFNQVETQ